MNGVVVDKVSRKIIAIIHNPISSSDTEIIGAESSVRGIDRNAADIHFYNKFDAAMGDELAEGLIEVNPPGLTEIEQLQVDNAGLMLELAQTQARQYQYEQDQADLLLSLVMGGVL